MERRRLAIFLKAGNIVLLKASRPLTKTTTWVGFALGKKLRETLLLAAAHHCSAH